MPDIFLRRRIAGIDRLVLTLVLLGASATAGAADARVLNTLIDDVLRRHVDDGYVDYPSIARNTRFYKYIEALAEFDADSLASDEERLVFWINAYNALAIKSVIDGVTPVNAIGRLKFFRTTEHRIAGKERDLRSIEYGIVLKLGEPRAHFALVSASYSGPKLRSEAYTIDKLQQQLEDNTRDFINDNRKNRFSSARRKAKLSEIFDWFRDDFEEDDRSVLDFVADYVNSEQTATELRARSYDIEYMEYDWSINGRPM